MTKRAWKKAIRAAIDKALQGPGVTKIEIPFALQYERPDSVLQPGMWEIGPGWMQHANVRTK